MILEIKEVFMSFKKCVYAMILVCGLSAQAQMEAMPQAKLASAYLVKITDMVKEDSCEVMSGEEVKALQKAISDEARVFNAAMIAVKKAWGEDELTKGTAFPSAAFSVRKMQQQGPFSLELANKKKDQTIDRECAAMDRENEREKIKKEQNKKNGIQEKKPSEKELEKAAKRETARQKAHDQLLAKIAELLKRDVPKKGL
jgi:hypothetical protein